MNNVIMESVVSIYKACLHMQSEQNDF